MATTFHIVRHGQTDWNRERRVQGHTDIPLNAEGRRQAHQLADELADRRIDAVYSSDLTRAVETAEILVETRRLAVARDPDLREKHFGTWEGLTDDAIQQRFPQAANGAWGDGETTAAMDLRVMAAIVRIAAGNTDNSVLVVTHGGPIRSLFRQAGLPPPAIQNCVDLRFSFGDGLLAPLTG